MPFQSSARGKYGAQSMKPTKGPLAPVWVTSGTIGNNIVQGSAFSFQLSATDDSNDTPVYSFGTGSLPTGISVSSSGLVSGTPSNSGTFNFTVNARDANGRTTASSTLTISVQNPLPQPQIWYKNTRVGQNPVINDGTFGSSYNSAGNPSTTTDSGRSVWNMSTSYLEYPQFDLLSASNNGNGWTIAAVLRNYNNAKYSLLGSPSGASQVVGNQGNGSNWQTVAYNNDGYPFPGSTTLVQIDLTSNMSQVMFRFQNNGQLTIYGPNRTNGAAYSGNLASGGGNPYSVAMTANRVGWSRGAQDSGWFLVEYLLWTRGLTDAEVTQVRNYLGSTHPVGVVNN
jgi:hypothetical protein